MTEQTCWIGIDVSNAELDVAVRPSGTRWQVRNDGAGIAALVERCAAVTPERIALEATGGYEMGVAAALGAEQLPVGRGQSAPGAGFRTCDWPIGQDRPSGCGRPGAFWPGDPA